jgi:prophage endopeptidase
MMNILIGKTMAVLLSSAALFASGLWVGHRFTRDHDQGVMARQELRFAAERQKLHEASARAQIDAKRKTIASERRKGKELAKVSRQYQQELEREKAKHRRTLAELDTTRRLYIGIRPASCSHDRISSTAPASGVDHDAARAELSTPSARFLVRLAAEADQVVRQLTACQNVVRIDREGQTRPR